MNTIYRVYRTNPATQLIEYVASISYTPTAWEAVWSTDEHASMPFTDYANAEALATRYDAGILTGTGKRTRAMRPAPAPVAVAAPAAPKKTIKLPTFGPVGRVTLKAAYMFVYSNFSGDTQEIAKYLGMPTADANVLMEQVPGVTGQLLAGGHDGVIRDFNSATRRERPGVPRLWQCWNTYDSENREAAEARIDAALDKAGF